MPIHVVTATADQCVLKWDAVVGESPLWHVGEQRLYWVDIPRGRVHVFHPLSGGNETYELPDLVTCLAFRARGGLIVTLKKNIAFYNVATRKLELGPELEGDEPGHRFNDGRVDLQGRFWAGTMGKEWKAPVGHLYRMDAAHRVTGQQSHVACSNGTAWSPDGRTMYHTESFAYTVWAYDFDPATGDIANRRPFATLPHGDVFPDGLCVDAEGFVWSNQVGAGRVVRYDPVGRPERELHLPVPRAAGSTFGGPDLSTLYVTSARQTMSRADLAKYPLSGSLFAIDIGVRGLPTTPFAG